MERERETTPERDAMKQFAEVILIVNDEGHIETKQGIGSPLGEYDAYLAVTNKNGEPYGEVDALLIDNQGEFLFIIQDDGRESVEIMADAIEQASSLCLNSIAISADTLAEVMEVKGFITSLLEDDPCVQKVGFYYPIPEKT